MLLQWIAFTKQGMSLLPLWTLVETLQLVAFVPVYHFNYIPYLYDAFKPALVSHLILLPTMFETLTWYRSPNHEYYMLSLDRLLQSLVFYGGVLAAIIIAHVVLKIRKS
jgi:hypothetical protein